MHGRIALAALAAISLLSLTGCEQLCSGTRGVFCPESSSNPLNRPPLATAGGGFLIARRHLPLTAVARGETLEFEADYEDPDGDALYYEWDLDGDGDFERAGYGSTARHTYAQLGVVHVTVRVSDFPQNIGAPGVITETRTVLVVDPARDHDPRAGFAIDPESLVSGVPVYFVGSAVFVDATPSSDPDDYDSGRLSYSFDAYQTDAAGNRLPGDPVKIIGDTVSPYWGFRFPRSGRWTIALDVRDAAGRHGVLARTIDVHDGPPVRDQAPHADFRITPGLPGLHEQVTLVSSSTDPDPGILNLAWDLDGDGRFETRAGSPLRTSFDAPGPRKIGLLVDDGFLRDVIYKEIDVLPQHASSSPTAPVASRAGARTLGLPFSARLSGHPLPGGGGEVRNRGGKMELLNVLGRGRLHARVLGPSRALRRFLNAPWRTRASFAVDPRTHRVSASAIALANVRGGSACLKVTLGNSTGSLAVLGGKGAGARVHASATFRLRLERDGSATVLGHLEARRGRARTLPATCRRLERN
jgi:hypothetical protein